MHTTPLYAWRWWQSHRLAVRLVYISIAISIVIAIVAACGTREHRSKTASAPVFNCAATYDNSAACTNSAVQALNDARANEGVRPFSLPNDWYGETPADQLTTITNDERTARGLSILVRDPALDPNAQTGADNNADPTYNGNDWASNWGGGYGNAIELVYEWMYNDGPGGANTSCTTSNTSGCYGHRENILVAWCNPCHIGSALSPTAYHGEASWAEIMVNEPAPPAPPPPPPTPTTTVPKPTTCPARRL